MICWWSSLVSIGTNLLERKGQNCTSHFHSLQTGKGTCVLTNIKVLLGVIKWHISPQDNLANPGTYGCYVVGKLGLVRGEEEMKGRRAKESKPNHEDG